MYMYKKISLIFVVILLIVSSVACQTSEKPQNKDTDLNNGNNTKKVVEKPPIPEAISQGENKEPRLKVYLTEGQRVEEMNFEDYVVGVLAGEMSNDFPMEALEAQAILARTFVMEFITEKGQSKYEGAHVSTDIEEAQAWNAKEVNEKVTKAVANTRGQVLLHNGKYVKSWFHAHAGGMTATAKVGLGYEEEEPPYIQAVESPDSKEAPSEDANWTATFSKGEIQAAMQKVGKKPVDFNNIEIVDKGPSGRAAELKIGDQTVQAATFRVALDSTKMKSTKLESISVAGDKVTMAGTGYGHGVGMSQWGAYQMAKDGKKYKDIINHYFKNVEIVTLWE